MGPDLTLLNINRDPGGHHCRPVQPKRPVGSVRQRAVRAAGVEHDCFSWQKIWPSTTAMVSPVELIVHDGRFWDIRSTVAGLCFSKSVNYITFSLCTIFSPGWFAKTVRSKHKSKHSLYIVYIWFSTWIGYTHIWMCMFFHIYIINRCKKTDMYIQMLKGPETNKLIFLGWCAVAHSGRPYFAHPHDHYIRVINPLEIWWFQLFPTHHQIHNIRQ